MSRNTSKIEFLNSEKFQSLFFTRGKLRKKNLNDNLVVFLNNN